MHGAQAIVLLAAIVAGIALPLGLFGYLVVKWASYREQWLWIRSNMVGRQLLPIVAGIAMFGIGIRGVLTYEEAYWFTEPVLSWWHCWLLLLLLDMVLIVDWLRRAVKHRIKKVKKVVGFVKDVKHELDRLVDDTPSDPVD